MDPVVDTPGEEIFKVLANGCIPFERGLAPTIPDKVPQKAKYVQYCPSAWVFGD